MTKILVIFTAIWKKFYQGIVQFILIMMASVGLAYLLWSLSGIFTKKKIIRSGITVIILAICTVAYYLLNGGWKS